MKLYHNDKQEFSANIFFLGLIMILGAFLISYIFYLITFELILIFSIIKVVLFWIVTKKFNIFHLYDSRLVKAFAIVIGIISGLILFSLPHVLDYNYFQNYAYEKGHSFGLLDYVNLVLDKEGYVFGMGSHQATRLDNWIFEIIKFFILILGPIFGLWEMGSKPYSTLKKSYFDKTFSVSYNKYKDDFLEKIDESNFKDTMAAFFCDRRRFENLNAEKGNFKLFEMLGDSKKILEICGEVYLLNREEYNLIIKYIHHFFKHKSNFHAP